MIFFTLSILFCSLYIQLYHLYWRIFISKICPITDPDLDVIGCRRRQLYIEPRWWVEGATGASGTTPLSIPQGVTVWPESSNNAAIPTSYAWLTEVALTYKWGNTVSSNAPNGTGAWVRSSYFIKTTNEAPDVLAGGSMCNAKSIHIVTVNWLRRTGTNASGVLSW